MCVVSPCLQHLNTIKLVVYVNNSVTVIVSVVSSVIVVTTVVTPIVIVTSNVGVCIPRLFV